MITDDDMIIAMHDKGFKTLTKRTLIFQKYKNGGNEPSREITSLSLILCSNVTIII